MRLTTAISCVVTLCVSSSVLGQAGDGYIGVFGDAAGTIRCMQAPAYVPITLYVVAKTAGATSSGIAGAEFRIEIVNPAGYFFGYTAPDNTTTFGDPLGSMGLDIAFPSCRVPIDSVVSLGTIQVLNIGSGGPTEIIVRRRNPPTNANYPCALLVHCDAPTYTKSCTTAPSDSVSCLVQKAGLSVATLQSDEFRTSLEGQDAPTSSSEYKGFLVTDSSAGFQRAVCVIEHQNPTCGQQIEAWVDINNSAASVWLQTGWHKMSSHTDVSTYYEYRKRDGTRKPITTVAVPAAGGTTYQVRKDGTSVYIEAVGSSGGFSIPLTWSDFYSDSDKLVAAEFSAEMHGGESDYTPGTNTQASPGLCDFSSAGVQTVGGGLASPDFTKADKMCPEATNGRFGPIKGNAFSTWDCRPTNECGR